MTSLITATTYYCYISNTYHGVEAYDDDFFAARLRQTDAGEFLRKRTSRREENGPGRKA